jgi:sulfatase modifying factor 1
MRTTIFMLLVGMMMIILAGCGGKSNPSLAMNGDQGSVSFSVKWPEMERNTGSRVIPTGTTKITITVKQNGVTVGSATITRPASTGTINAIPVGSATVEANACNSANIVLASGNTMVTVVKNATSNAYLALISTGINGDTGIIKSNSTDNAEMVWVPGGTFMMGTTVTENLGFPAGPSTQQTTLIGYWVYKYEVTVAQYRAFCAASGHSLPTFPSGYSWTGKTDWTNESLQQHPIVNVSWNDAKAYADWFGVTLPTEAQWEYTASGPNGNNYPWGGIAISYDCNNGWDLTKCVNQCYYNNNSQKNNPDKSTWPVGSFPSGASWCGVQDLAGNASEWCSDKCVDVPPYSLTPVINPTGSDTGNNRIYRGSSWDNTFANNFRNSYRSRDTVDAIRNNHGFRCVSNTPGP